MTVRRTLKGHLLSGVRMPLLRDHPANGGLRGPAYWAWFDRVLTEAVLRG